jgi:hypothetical protein
VRADLVVELLALLVEATVTTSETSAARLRDRPRRLARDRAPPREFNARHASSAAQTVSRSRRLDLGACSAGLDFVGRARRSTSFTSSADGNAARTRVRGTVKLLISNDGFSVVAPMNTLVPSSTNGRNRSCCALLKRCTSSRNRIVARPRSRAMRAASTAARISLTPAITAESATNSASRCGRPAE